MKKIFTLIALAVAFVSGVQAQTVTINKVDGTKVTYNASEISSIEFGAQADTSVVHSFGPGSAYLLVSSGYFKNSYYGQNSTMTVLQTGDKENPQYLAKFEDPTWGTGLFNITMGRGTIDGTGTLTMPNPHAKEGEPTTTTYDATMSGSMMNININVPDVMGGTTINWIYGKAPLRYTVAGDYEGQDTLSAMGSDFPVDGTSTFNVTMNADSTINVTFPAESFTVAQMGGGMSLSSYTISNIAWDEAENAYVRDYHNDGVKVTFNGSREYTLSDESCKIKVYDDKDGKLHVDNTFALGVMTGLSSRFTGTKK